MTLLFVYMGVSALLILIAAVMERQGLRNDVSGANGFILTMVCLLCLTSIFALGLLVWIFQSFGAAFGQMAMAAAWVAALFFVGLMIMMTGQTKK